jgi:MATE family multidrug resistance protein
MLLVPASMLEAGLSAYFVGRRQTRPVLGVTILTSVINVALDALLIFGMLGFPQLGIWGAALATVISAWLKVGFYGWLIFRDTEFRTRLTSSLQLSVSTAREIALPGLAVGFQNQIRTLVFSGVLMAIGATSAISLAASSATFTVYQLLAIPVIGLANAVTVFAGQASSSGTPQLRKTVRSSFRVAGVYAVGLAGTMLMFPEAVLWPMTIGMQAEEQMTVIPKAAVFMRFAAFYCLSETAGMISGSLIKGMGRTSLMLLTTGFCSVLGYLILQAVDAGQRFSTDHWWLALVIWSTAQATILTAATFRQANRPIRSSADEDELEVHKPAADSSPEAVACSVTS